MLTLLSCNIKRRDRRLVLPSRLTGRGADHDLKDLIFAEARCPRDGDVRIGDLVCMLCQLVDQRP